MRIVLVVDRRNSDNLAGIVDCLRLGASAPRQHPQILELTVLPEYGSPHLLVVRANSDNLTLRIDCTRNRILRAERRKGGRLSISPQACDHRRRTEVGAIADYFT